MNTIYAIILSTLFCTTHVFSMINSPITSVPEHFSHDLKKQIVYWAVERPINVDFYNKEDTIQLIRTISLLNKEWYDYVNHPITTLNSINHLAKKSFLMNSIIAKEFLTPGSKNYIACSEKLFTTTITAQEIKDLVTVGADLNYICSKGNQIYNIFPIYLIACNRPIGTLQTALNLGVDINQRCRTSNWLPLEYAIQKDLPTVVQLLLQYKPQQKHFHYAVTKRNIKIIDLLIQAGASPDEGLSQLIHESNNFFPQAEHKKRIELLKYFLDKGANPTKNLLHLYEKTFDSIKIQHLLEYDVPDELELLCSYGGYDEKALNSANIAKEKIDRMIELFEKNKPHK